MSTFLSDADLIKLTDARQRRGQERALEEMGIPYKVRGRSIIVLEQHAAAWMEGRPVPRFVEPDFSCVK